MMSRSIRSTFRLLILTLLALLMIPLTQAQSPPNVTIRHIEATAKENGEVRVSTIVSVHTAEGLPISNLRSNDFTVLEGNTAINSNELTVALATNPTNTILLIDTSSNMASPDSEGIRAIDRAKDAVVGFIDKLQEGDQIAVYEYSNQLSLAQDFTFDHNLAIDQGVATLNAHQDEGACLSDALLQIVDLAADIQQKQQVVIVLTGNPDSAAEGECSGTTLNDVLATVTTFGNRPSIFIAGFGNRIDQDDLSLLTRLTGGQSLLTPDPKTLTEPLMVILDQLQNQYEVSYPTQSDSGSVEVTVKENNSQQSDRRQVLIPAAIEPTPTPVPQFLIELTADPPVEGKVKIKVNILDDITLEKTELFINNELEKKAVSPPFDLFEIDVIELGSGVHNIRVEATDENGVTASAETQLTLTIPPTPIPTLPPEPKPVEATTPTDNSGVTGSIPILAIILIGAGVIVFLIFLGLIVWFFLSQSKQPAPAPIPVYSPSPAPPPIMPMITVDDISIPPLADTGKTIFEDSIPPFKATLKVTKGSNFLSQTTFELDKSEIKIGRNAGTTFNDIHINDKRVSRSHAKILYRDHQFFVQDLASSSGSWINNKKIEAHINVKLQNESTIKIGPKVEFEFSAFDKDETMLAVEFAEFGVDQDRTILDGEINIDLGKTIDELNPDVVKAIRDIKKADRSSTTSQTNVDQGFYLPDDDENKTEDVAQADDENKTEDEAQADEEGKTKRNF